MCIANLAANMSATPMMQQYQSIRRTLPEGTLLLFRLGDFYELFFEDAKIAAPILNVALTKRNGMPMCGVPFHAAEAYVGRLIKAGHRVAICDQTSEPQPGRIVERQVSQIISPGTVSDIPAFGIPPEQLPRCCRATDLCLSESNPRATAKGAVRFGAARYKHRRISGYRGGFL